MAKDPKTGREVPWNPSPNDGWIDGSVDNDLPMTRLAEMFNVNHFIVSQVNPHVVPFLAKEEDAINADVQQNSSLSAGSSWMHTMANFAKGEALHRLEVLAEMGIFPNTMTKARSVLNQRYSGDITIFPAISYANFPKILTNPTSDFMERCLFAGEQATWTKVSRIQNHLAIELALDEAVNEILPYVHFSQSQANLRLLSFHRPLSQGADLPPMHHSRGHKREARSESHGAPIAAFTPFIEISSPDLNRSQGTCADLTTSKPYLPSRPAVHSAWSPDFNRVAFSTVEAISSTEPDSPSDADVSDNIDSDTSEILSSPSPMHSPPPHVPGLWHTTRDYAFPFPSVSKPHTPAAPPSLFTSGYSAPANTTNAAPSSPELRYKRLFHPPSTQESNHPPHKPDAPRLPQPHPLGTIPGLRHTESNPEHQDAPPGGGLKKQDSLDERNVRAFKGLDPAALAKGIKMAALSPLSTIDGTGAESYFQARPRRGNGTPRW